MEPTQVTGKHITHQWLTITNSLFAMSIMKTAIHERNAGKSNAEFANKRGTCRRSAIKTKSNTVMIQTLSLSMPELLPRIQRLLRNQNQENNPQPSLFLDKWNLWIRMTIRWISVKQHRVRNDLIHRQILTLENS